MSEYKLIPTNEEIKGIETMAKYACDSKFFNNLGGASGIFSIMMYAKEIGIPPMQAVMGGMHNIQGKIQVSPALMNSMIRRAGHKLEIDSTDARCIIKGTRKDTGETCTVSFSVDDARKANIYKAGGGWEKYPSDMCFARAISRLSRRLFPDVIGVSYVEGEIQEEAANKKSSIVDNSEDTQSIRKPRPVEKEIIDIDIDQQFFRTFESLDQDDLNNFISSRPNSEETMKKALSDVEGFKKWFNERYSKKQEIVEDKFSIDIIQAMKEGKV